MEDNMTMIERVARAIQHEAGAYVLGDGLAINLSIAAIAAMHEPTKNMILAGEKGVGDAASVWQAMIDEALRE